MTHKMIKDTVLLVCLILSITTSKANAFGFYSIKYDGKVHNGQGTCTQVKDYDGCSGTQSHPEEVQRRYRKVYCTLGLQDTTHICYYRNQYRHCSTQPLETKPVCLVKMFGQCLQYSTPISPTEKKLVFINNDSYQGDDFEYEGLNQVTCDDKKTFIRVLQPIPEINGEMTSVPHPPQLKPTVTCKPEDGYGQCSGNQAYPGQIQRYSKTFFCKKTLEDNTEICYFKLQYRHCSTQLLETKPVCLVKMFGQCLQYSTPIAPTEKGLVFINNDSYQGDDYEYEGLNQVTCDSKRTFIKVLKPPRLINGETTLEPSTQPLVPQTTPTQKPPTQPPVPPTTPKQKPLTRPPVPPPTKPSNPVIPIDEPNYTPGEFNWPPPQKRDPTIEQLGYKVLSEDNIKQLRASDQNKLLIADRSRSVRVSSGKVISWEVYLLDHRPVTLSFWRPLGPTSKKFSYVGGTRFNPVKEGLQTLELEPTQQYNVKRGDVIGIYRTGSNPIYYNRFHSCENQQKFILKTGRVRFIAGTQIVLRNQQFCGDPMVIANIKHN